MRKNPPPPLTHKAFDILGLSEAERRVLISLWPTIGRQTTDIARIAKVPVPSIATILRRLEKRHLVCHSSFLKKQKHWHLNIAWAVRVVRQLDPFPARSSDSIIDFLLTEEDWLR